MYTKFKVVGRAARLSAGTVRISKEQAELRSHNLTQLRKGVFEIKSPIEFKSGEIFEYDGDLPKAMAEDVEEAEHAAARAAENAQAAAKRAAAEKEQAEAAEKLAAAERAQAEAAARQAAEAKAAAIETATTNLREAEALLESDEALLRDALPEAPNRAELATNVQLATAVVEQAREDLADAEAL